MPDTGYATQSYEAESRSLLSDVRRFVAAASEPYLEQPSVHDLVLAVTEACANAIRHSGTAEVRVTVHVDGRCVEIVVEDDGVYRMTLPVVVMGISSRNATSRGYSCAERRAFTKPWISAASASDGSWPGFGTMNALTISVRIASGLPTTAASATAGCRMRQSSISVGPMRYPADVITSSLRPTK